MAENETVETQKKAVALYFYLDPNDPVWGGGIPDDEEIASMIVDGIEKRVAISGYVEVESDWVHPFNKAFYCGDCNQCFPDSEKALDKDGDPIEFGDYDLCKTCLDKWKEEDPAVYKDMMGEE